MPKLKKPKPRTPDSDPALKALYGPLETALDECDRLLHRQKVFIYNHAHGKNVFCRDFKHGKCEKGDNDCTWSHDGAFEWEFTTRKRRKMKSAAKVKLREERRAAGKGGKKRMRGKKGGKKHKRAGVSRTQARDVEMGQDAEEVGIYTGVGRSSMGTGGEVFGVWNYWNTPSCSEA
jgi:hypothetical protein